MATEHASPPVEQLTLNILAEAAGNDLAQALAQKPNFRPVAHPTLESLVKAITAQPNSVVIFEASGSVDVVKALSMIRETSTQVPGVMLGNDLPVSAVKSLLALNRWDILELPTSFDSLCETIGRVATKPGSITEKAAPAKQGKCWAFTSPVGGGGATFLAVETAFQLSQSEEKPRTCLIDMNFFDGSCAQYLNCESNLTLSALDTTPDRIDAVLLNALTTRHKSGVELIAAPRTSDPDAFPSRAAVLRCLEIACEVYDYVIVDMPRWPMPWTMDIVSGADETLLISELTVPALNAARDWIIDFDNEVLPGTTCIKPVLNRRQKSLFGSSVSIEQAEKAIQQPVFGSVHSDWPAAMAAVNLGQPVSLAKPNSVIVKDVAAMIASLQQPNASALGSISSKKRVA